MTKAGKIVGGFFTTIIIIVVVLPMLLSLLLQDTKVQSWIVNRTSSIASSLIGSEVSIGRVDIGKFYYITLDDIFIESEVGRDTLLHIKSLKTRLATLRNLSTELFFDNAVVRGGQFNLYSTDSLSNIKEVIDRSKGKFSKSDKPKIGDSSFKLKISKIDIEGFTFRLERDNPESVSYGINYQDMELSNGNLKLDNFELIGDSITTSIRHISMYEKGGVTVDGGKIDTAIISGNGMRFIDGNISINGNTSADFNIASLDYRNWEMHDYTNRVEMEVELTSSVIDMSTVQLFTTGFRNWNNVFRFQGNAKGVVNDMRGHIFNAASKQMSIVNTDFYLRDVTQSDSLYLDFNIGSMVTTLDDASILVNDFLTESKITIPEGVNVDRAIDIDGRVNGYISDLKADCNFSIADNGGLLSANVAIINSDTLKVKGDITTSSLEATMLYPKAQIGALSCRANVNISAGGENTIIELMGDIDSLNFDNYKYNSVHIDAGLKGGTARVHINSKDNNLLFDLSSIIDLNGAVPEYNLNLNLNKANLAAIGIVTRDSISLLQTKLIANISGTELDNINGDIIVNQLEYLNDLDTLIATQPLKLKARNNSASKSININSEFFDLSLRGVSSYSQLATYIVREIDKYMPALDLESSILKRGENSFFFDDIASSGDIQLSDYYLIRLDINKASRIASIFIPTLDLANGSRLSLLFNPASDIFSFSLSSDYISLKDDYLSNISLDAKNNNDIISIFGNVEEALVSSLYLPNLNLIGEIGNNIIKSDFGFNNPQDNTYAFIKTQSEIIANGKEKEYKVTVLPSNLSLYKDVWNSSGGEITFKSGHLSIENFLLTSTDQLLSINGAISSSDRDSIVVLMNNFSFKPINLFTSSIGFDIEGAISGKVKATGIINQKGGFVDADLVFGNNLKINGVDVPDSRLYTQRNELNRDFKFYVQSNNTTYIEGEVSPATFSYNVDVKIPAAEIAVVNPYLSSFARDVSGTAGIDINISNPNRYMSINGVVDIPNFEAVISETNVRYTIKGKANIVDNQYTLDNGIISDTKGGGGSVRGYLTNERYKKVKYNITATTTNLHALNTTVNENTLYYGNVYAKGQIALDGDRNKITLSVDAEPSKASTFFMPLGENNLSEVSFIKFDNNKDDEDKRTSLFKERKSSDTSTTFGMIMNLRTTPLLETEIVMDATTGSSLKAKGVGALSLRIEPDNEIFDINGEYSLDAGTYRFILPNFTIIDKTFNIRSGSWIRWSGDAMGATINVNAAYPVKASLAPLLGNTFTSRVNVDCELKMDGALISPNISLGIETPEANPEEQSAIKNVLNTQEAISMQIFYLLLSSSFSPPAEGLNAENFGELGAVTTGVEFLTNQISNIFSTDKIDFGINYMPLGEMTSNEVGVDLSAPILSDRLFIDMRGNYNFYDNDNEVVYGDDVSSFSGDVYLTWVVNNSGNMSMKAFTRTIDTFDENQGDQESGIGIYFSVSFENWQDLKLRYTDYMRRRRERRQQRKASKKEERIEKRETKKSNN